MRPSDSMLTRKVRSEFIRRELDCSGLETRVIHGVAYLGGELKSVRGRRVWDWKKEIAILEEQVLKIYGIRGIDNRIRCVEAL